MSFTSMHNDYLDPDKYFTEPSEAEIDMDALLIEAAKWDSWNWHQIHICLTGKHADLDPCGQQGIEIVSCDDEGVLIRVHAGKTIAGLGVSLAADYDTDEEYQAALEEYLAIATEIICDMGYPGEWTGDDWYIRHSESVKVPWVIASDEAYDYAQTVANCVRAAEVALKEWDAAMLVADDALNAAAGYRTEKAAGGAI